MKMSSSCELILRGPETSGNVKRGWIQAALPSPGRSAAVGSGRGQINRPRGQFHLGRENRHGHIIHGTIVAEARQRFRKGPARRM
jgi:hypothetical protein